MTKSNAKAAKAGLIGFGLWLIASIFLIISFFLGWAFAGVAAVVFVWGSLLIAAAENLRATKWSVGDLDGRDD